MKKFYVEPNVEYIGLLTQDIITDSAYFGDGGSASVGDGSNLGDNGGT